MWFESSHWKFYLPSTVFKNWLEDKNKERKKRSEMAEFYGRVCKILTIIAVAGSNPDHIRFLTSKTSFTMAHYNIFSTSQCLDQ